MSLWQTQSWQDMLIASGQTQEYFVIEQNLQSPDPQKSGLEKKIFVEKRKVSFGQYGLFVIGFEGEIDEQVREHLQELCKEENVLFAQIETLSYDTKSISIIKGEDGEENGMGDFKMGYYKKFIPPYTAVIDLTQSEEEILAAMKPKGRYNIKLAEKKAVRVEQVDKNPYNAKIFFELMQETTNRNNFSGNSLAYYQSFLKNIEKSQLFFAYFQEKVIAAGIFVASDTTMLYYYGASSHEQKSLMAPYLLQWTVMQHAKKRGLLLYDFLGIATPGDTDSSLMGVTDFKLKFTQDMRYISQSYIFIQKPFLFKMIGILKYMRTYIQK